MTAMLNKTTEAVYTKSLPNNNPHMYDPLNLSQTQAKASTGARALLNTAN